MWWLFRQTYVRAAVGPTNIMLNSMKRTIVLIAIVSLVPSTAGCGNPSTNTPSGVPLKHKIDFKVPKGWELQAQGTTLMKGQ